MTPQCAWDIERILVNFSHRCDIARNVGISAQDVFESGRPPPEGYWFDYATEFWIPQNIALFAPTRPREAVK